MVSKTLYIVHCVDTEGPLNETLDATFERLNKAFGLKIKPSQKKLIELQNKKVNINGLENSVADFLSPKLLRYNKNLKELEEMLAMALSKKFRTTLLDDYGQGWIYSWYCVDHINLNKNPRSKIIGYGRVFEFYKNILKKLENKSDDIYWHFHPRSISNNALQAATSYYNSMSTLIDIICKRIIKHQWFPTCNRPGFHAERPDSHMFLEQWIPFDFANQFCKQKNNQPDLSMGRFGDWRRSSSSWRGYYPDHFDYQVKGKCNRRIFRCLNVGTRFNLLKESHIIEAFNEAQKKGKAILAFANHDYRDLRPDVLYVKKILKKVKVKFSDVKIRYSNAENAARQIVIEEAGEIKKPEIEIFIKDNRLIVNNKGGQLFGPQPFLSIQTKKNKFYHDNFDFQKPRKQWSYTFDDQTIKIEDIKSIGVASAGAQGFRTVKIINL